MSIHKRIPALLLGVILLFAGIPAGSISAQAADTTQQLNNIVLFAQFPDADTDNFMADKTDTAIAICNDTSTPRSLTSYIDAISYGKLHVTSYFPQLADGVIQPYILQNSKAEYTNYEQYAIEMVQNIQIPDSIPLDGNQDGMTDNITLVIDGRAESMGDPLWAKAFQVGGLYLGDTPVGSINLMSSYTLLSAAWEHSAMSSCTVSVIPTSTAKTVLPATLWDSGILWQPTPSFCNTLSPISVTRFPAGWTRKRLPLPAPTHYSRHLPAQAIGSIC